MQKQQITCDRTSISLSADFSVETVPARNEWHNIFEMMKGENLQPRILYPASIHSDLTGKYKSYTDKQKLREFCTTKTGLQQMLKKRRWKRKAHS